MQRSIKWLVVFLLLPVSPKAETVCVYEIDTTWTTLPDNYIQWEVDSITGAWKQTLRRNIDTIPHWIIIPIQISAGHADAVYFGDEQLQIDRLDTVFVYDTIFMPRDWVGFAKTCNHAWEWEWKSRIDNLSDYTTDEYLSWCLDGDFPLGYGCSNAVCYKTGTSRCIYCGEVRKRKE